MFKNVKSQQDVHKLIEDCANIDYVLADEVSACVRDTDGQKYLSEMRNRTLEQIESMEHAPWIVINGVRSALAQSDLKTAICDAMVGDKPDYCYEPTPAKVNVVFHYSAQDSKVQDYVLNELYPHYRNLEEIVDLDVVPFGLTEIKTNEDGNYTLICDNGLNECRVNLIHGCLYNEYYHNDDDPVSDNQEEYDGKLQVIEWLNSLIFLFDQYFFIYCFCIVYWISVLLLWNVKFPKQHYRCGHFMWRKDIWRRF